MATMLLLLFHRRSRPLTITSSPSTHGQSGSRTPRHATCRFSEWTSRVLHGCFLRRSCALALPIAGFASRDVQPSHGLLSWPRHRGVVAPTHSWKPSTILAQAILAQDFGASGYFRLFFFFSCLCCHDGPQCPVVGIRCPTEVARVWESNGRSTSAIQKTSKVQGRVQCLEAAVWQLLGRCSEDRDRGHCNESGTRSRRINRTSAPVGLPTLSRSGHESGSPGSNKPFKQWEICSVQRPTCCRKCQSELANQRKNVLLPVKFQSAHVSSSSQHIASERSRPNGRWRWQLSKRHTPDRSSIQDVPTRCSHEHCHQNRFGRDCRIGGVEGEVGFHGTGARRQLANGKRCRRPIESVVKFQDNARIVNVRHGQRGVRVGEASHPGPTTRRRTQRLRALPWVWDSGSEFEDDSSQ